MPSRHKGLVVILDGLGDSPMPTLGNRTPLEAARTPYLDRLAADGLCGVVDPLSPGVAVGTQSGVGTLMGVLPEDIARLTRGAVEAAGIELTLHPGDIALRCNFATLRREAGHFAIVDRRAGRIAHEAAVFAEALADVDLGGGIRATVRQATHHRAVLRLRGPGLDPRISDTDPGAAAEAPRLLPCRALAEEATATATALNRFLEDAHARLDVHPVNRERIARGELPANGLITRGAGMPEPVRSLVTRLGLRAAVVAGEGTVVGLGKLFGFDVVTDARFTALPDTDIEAKVAAAVVALESHDLVFLHFKGPDICAHDFDPAGKARFIERVDAALAAIPTDDLVVGVSGDHTTDSGTGAHSGEPVPSLLRAPRARPDDCRVFGETACARGALGRISSTGYLVHVLKAMGVPGLEAAATI